MKLKAKLITHRGERRIAVLFEKDSKLIAYIKTFNGAKWSASRCFWHLPDTVNNR